LKNYISVRNILSHIIIIIIYEIIEGKILEKTLKKVLIID